MDAGATHLTCPGENFPCICGEPFVPQKTKVSKTITVPQQPSTDAAECQSSERRTDTIEAMRIPVFHVDAFTDQPFRGNAAAVCPLQAWLDDETLRKVAAENNLSETAFFLSGAGSYELRWFTPRGEVRLCGHATLGAAYAVLNVLTPEQNRVQFETRHSGVLTVCKDGNLFSMSFPALLPTECAAVPNLMVQALGGLSSQAQVLEVNGIYIAIFEDESTIQNMRPDFSRLELLHPAVVAVTAPGDTADFVSRYFKPSYGMPEDPVTGSAHCALTPYWAERLGKAQLHARQLSERGGELWCELAGDRVILKGNAVLTMQGTLEI